MVTKRYSRGELRRARLLDAAVAVIAEHGLEGVTHRAVAAAAGVPLATTSYFFSSLDELVGAAVTRVADAILESADVLAEGAPVEHTIDLLVEVVTAPTVLVQFEAYLGRSRRPELVEPVTRIVEAYESAATTVLRSLGVLEPARAARHLIALLDGFALQRIAHPRPDDREVLRDAVRLFARAYLPSQ
ncbi:TetR/AcrR family transcriptional regulator [Cryptosporangium japonicum]|uniref:TetR family transcriptional regulator n=1 Tax=Cryptosporangium japonicum TaxID=80872 RepID=A0ABN0U0Z8_9ACTN